METASLILSIISLGIDIKTIISDYIMSNKTLDDLLNKAIQKARKDANIDSQYLPGKPLNEKTLNNVLLDLVIKHVNDESIDIPHWLLENEFYKFYDSLMQNVDFLNFLHQELESHQHLLQNEKLDEANSILKEIRNQIELLSQQQLLQNEKLDSIDETTKEIKNQIRNQIESLSEQQLIENEKLDTIDETTKEIKEHVEKPRLPDWLVPYEIELSTNSKTVFLQDAHENLIRENRIYRKTDTIEKIKNWLDTKGFGLIIAPEGRGKTFLSRIIAFDYHENDTIVYFVDCRNESVSFYNEMESLRSDWNKDKNKKYLLVLENVHACSDSESLKQTIENQTINQEEIRTNIKFLLNARPTIVDYDCFKDWEETINLNPDTRDIKEIVNLYRIIVGREPFENEDSMTGFIKSISPNDDDTNGANLRLLGIYLRTWQNHKEIQYVSDVTEENIYNDFISTYKLKDSLDRDTVLLFISSLFQFDVPIPSKAVRLFLKNEEIDNIHLLNNLVKEGLLIKSRDFYYLPHSFEAYFLFKAICYKQKMNYIDKTDEFVRFFIDEFILEQNKPRNYENDFRLLYSGLKARKEEFKNSIQYLISFDKAKEIIENLNPGFVIPFFQSSVNLNALCLYEENKKWFISSFLKLNPSELSTVVSIFKTFLHYNGNIVKDIFESTDDLNGYLKNHYQIFQNKFYFIKAIVESDSEYRKVLIDNYKQNIDRLKPSFFKLSPTNLTFVYKAFRRKPLDYNIAKDIFKKPSDFDEYLRNHNHKILMRYDGIIKAIRDLGEEYRLIHKSFMVRNGYDYFFYSKKRSFCISQFTIDFYWNSKKPFDVFQIHENDFMFYEVHWDGMGRFIKIISYNMNENNRKHSINIVKAIIQIVLNSKESLSHASAHDLSLFYANIASVDKNLFKNLINERFVIKDIKYRLSSQKYSLNDLRLFSHFYDEEWFYRDMKKIVNRTLESLNEADEKDLSTFLGNISHMNAVFYNDLIVNETIVGIAKKRFETFSFREDYLYLFGHFYSQPWCKEILEQKINNADDGQIAIIKEWYDKVMEGLKKRSEEGEETEAKGGLLEYIHNKPFIQQQNN